MPITINGTGTITGISAGGLPDAIITQAELATPVAGTGPAFSVLANAAQTISGFTQTKVVLNSEQFDTANCFDSTTNYRYTPNVAGYYQFHGCVYFQAGSSGQVTSSIWKNGSVIAAGFVTPSSVADIGSSTSALIYMNGSTDYVELYTYQNSGATRQTFGASGVLYTYFQGFLARAA
jgi:hypothetical protein